MIGNRRDKNKKKPAKKRVPHTREKGIRRPVPLENFGGKEMHRIRQ